MSPDSIFWLGRAWYTLPAISVKVRESLVEIPGDCTTSHISWPVKEVNPVVSLGFVSLLFSFLMKGEQGRGGVRVGKRRKKEGISRERTCNIIRSFPLKNTRTC